MTALENRIVENVWRFDPVSLLQLLLHLGYSLEDMLFCSHVSRCSQSRLIQAIEFQNSFGKKVIISLNLGLLSGQSLLPAYFFKQVDDNIIDEQRFAEFFGYFDDRLLRRWLLAIYPELDDTLQPNWESRKATALHTLKLDSLVSLHWLTQLVFPELQVRVEKAGLERSIDLGGPILGKTKLGYQAVLGKIKKCPVAGKRITLISDTENFTQDRSWPEEIERRLEKLLFPQLQELDLDVEIWLTIRTQGTALNLKENSYLGYENLFGEQLQPRNIRIFSGYLSA
jgi:hypothetical protein